VAQESLSLAGGAHDWHALMLVHGWLMGLQFAGEADAGGAVADGASAAEVGAYALVADEVLL
jgi:hypothetical protein